MSSPATIKQLPANIPQLEPDGSNWAIFTGRFREAMQATRRWPHFDGTSTCPSPKVTNKPTDDEKKEIEKWEHADNAACYLLSQRLPDSVTIRLYALTTAKARWDHLVKKFTAQSIYAQNDLEQAFFDMQCTKGMDVRVFLTSLRYKREELAAVGVQVSPREYQRTVLKSLPDELAKFASQALTSACHSGHPLDTDTLINSVIEESEHLKNRRARSQPGQGKKSKEGQADEALAATGSEGSRRKRRPGNCHNCGKPGHWAHECRKPKKKKDSDTDSSKQNESTTSTKPENKPVGSANVVVEHDFEGDGFWMAVEEDLVAPALNFGADPDPCLGDPDDLEGDAPDELNFA